MALVATTAVALTVATYLAYTVFDDWWYIRFLLPALPVLLFVRDAARAGGTRDRGRDLRSAGRMVPGRRAGSAGVRAGGLESRFRIAGAHAARAFRENVVFSVQESGALRFYAVADGVRSAGGSSRGS